MKHLFTTAAASALMAGTAFAGNIEPAPVEPVIAPAPMPAQSLADWSGFYLGGQAGYGRTSSISVDGETISGIPDPGDIFSMDGFSLKPDGGLGGIHAGYFHDAGQFVIGGELDYDWADISDSTSVDFLINNEPVALDVNAKLKLTDIGRIKLIAGYDLGDGLLYGTAGAFRAKMKATVSGPGVSMSDSETDNGWLIGAGYKHKFTDNWIGGVEVLYHEKKDFGDSDFDLKLTTITARASYKF